MSESKPKKKYRTGCTYRVLRTIAILGTGYWLNAGVLADLSDLSDERIHRLLKYAMIETAEPAEGETVVEVKLGVSAGAADVPCPCGR
ncbi:MAG TPA: hypothetical protein VMZ31_09425, partial [Phycisphaerae bacterium]|nr:hypothetical protein [Phycisphaerae bacterium]